MPTAEELYEHAVEFYKNGDKESAKSHLDQVCLIDPSHSRGFALRAAILFNSGHNFDAILNYDRAIAINPAAEYLVNKQAALVELDQWDEGEKILREAVRLKPNLVQAWNNLGRLLLIRGHLELARTAFEIAIKIDPNYVDAHLGLAFLALEVGEFEVGWKEYEWRKKSLPQKYVAPEWNGEILADNEAILLRSEQGIGDAIQFCRYAPLVKKNFGGKVYLECRPSAMRMLQSLDGIDGVIGYGDAPPSDVKYSQRLLSCPLIFRHFSERDFPAPVSYLSASKTRVEMFSSLVSILPDSMPKVGFCWAGNAGMPFTDRRRSTNLSMWKPLADIPNIGWITLQKGPPAIQLRQTKSNMTILDLIEDCDDIADTAALIMNCDLVISVDTLVAHLAAALGKPTWVLSRRDACWRWMGDRTDSPWYPTVRHYRQPKFNDWDGLMKIVAVDLDHWVRNFSRVERA